MSPVDAIPHVAQPLNIILVASEAVPFAKTGGLADVAGSFLSNWHGSDITYR